MRRPFARVDATPAEAAAPAPGDGLVPAADVVMDSGFDLSATPEQVWPWIVQLGKGRGGWYLPWTVERRVPRSHRAARSVEERWQDLAVGDVVPDYGGSGASFEAVEVEPPGPAGGHIVYRSERGRVRVSWAIMLTPTGPGTRVHLRLRLGPVRRVRLARSLGGLFDSLTIAGMAAGLRERLGDDPSDGARGLS